MLTAGKSRALARLSDGQLRFFAVAIDQRPPLMDLVRRAVGDLADEELEGRVRALKGLLAETLSDLASAVLIDPRYGLPTALPRVPRETGLLLTLEHHRFEERGGFRLSGLIPGWSAERAVAAGADGLKLLAWHRPEAPAEITEQQVALVRRVGEACRQLDRAFVLELLPYPLPGESPESYRRKLRALSQDILDPFADPGLGVDLYKLALPVAADSVADWGGDGPSLAELEGDLRAYGRLPAPWLLLSGGLDATQFAQALAAALRAGARGYLAGRAVWLEPLSGYPDLIACRQALLSRGRRTLQQLSDQLAILPPQQLETDWVQAGVGG